MDDIYYDTYSVCVWLWVCEGACVVVCGYLCVSVCVY